MNAECLLDPLSILARICVAAATLECLQLGGRDLGDSVIGTQGHWSGHPVCPWR